MRLTESLVFYSLVGLSCGVYQARMREDPTPTRALLLFLSIPFWPLLLPLLFPSSRKVEPATRERTPLQPGPFHDEIRASIECVEDEMRRSEGAAGRLLSQELTMLDAITQQLHWLDGKLHELQGLLAQPTFSIEVIEAEYTDANAKGAGRMALESLKVKKQNAQQMKAFEEEYKGRIEDSLALLGRIHSQITLLRFSGEHQSHLSASLEQLLDLLDGLEVANELATQREGIS